MPLVYLGAAISGLRPARWYASRLMPLLGACVIAVVLVTQPWWWITAAGTLLASACLAVGLLHVAKSRDF
jgi:hypothetical protein